MARILKNIWKRSFRNALIVAKSHKSNYEKYVILLLFNCKGTLHKYLSSVLQ